MPIGEIAGEVVGGLLRVVAQGFMEIIGEVLLRGLGYALWRRVSPHTDPEGWPSLVVGLLFWAAVIVLGVLLYQHLAQAIALDRCLDAGGRFVEASGECLRT